MTKNEWIKNNLNNYKNANKDVIEFIARILYHSGSNNTESINFLFRQGYCYYFAQMLKDAFGRGNLYLAYPEQHIVWLDGNDVSKDLAYDINGVNKNWKKLIPIAKLGSGILDFKHIPNIYSDLTDTEFDVLLEN